MVFPCPIWVIPLSFVSTSRTTKLRNAAITSVVYQNNHQGLTKLLRCFKPSRRPHSWPLSMSFMQARFSLVRESPIGCETAGQHEALFINKEMFCFKTMFIYLS
jgi:hypothetical protein